MSLTTEDLKILTAKFSDDALGIKVQSFSKDKTKAMLVAYLQHTDVAERLDQVDPSWNFEIKSETVVDQTVIVHARLTVKGVFRDNAGEGEDSKSAASDALKRCAMLFGVGRFLYDAPQVWTDYNDQRDRFRHWTVAEYRALMRPADRKNDPTMDPAKSPSAPPVQAKPGPTLVQPNRTPEGRESSSAPMPAPTQPTREQLQQLMMQLYKPYLTRFPQTKMSELLYGRYGLGESRLLTTEQIQDFVNFLDRQLTQPEPGRAK